MRILVTGGTGFIGTHLVEALVERGHEVATVSRRVKGVNSRAQHYMADLAAGVPEVVGQVDAIVHLAAAADASSSFADPLAYNRINALGTLNMLEMARNAGALFVLASTQRIYRPQNVPLPENASLQPVDPYGYSKLVSETWTRMYREVFQTRTVILRFFSVFGPGALLYGGTSGVVSIFAHRALRGEPLRVSDGNLRDFTYVDDVVRGITLALEKPVAIGQTFNIATGVATSIGELARAMKDVTGSPSEVIVAGTAAVESYVADISRARIELDYTPCIELRRGLELYVGSLRENG